MRGAPEPVFVRSDDVRLAVYVSGPNDAPPVMLVHGYPDSARIWNALRSKLETRFRVIAYDVRGMEASVAPRARSGYALAQLARDLLAVANATCGTRAFHLLAHDWGSIQCWEAVTDPANASRIVSYTSISGPCLDHVFLKPRVPAQLLKSWHTGIPVQIIVPRFDRYVTPAMSEGVERWLGAHQREIIAAPHWAVVSEARQIAARFARFATCASPCVQGFDPNLHTEDRQ
ncbi:alpha/beta fold hydrolase [Paraburkholderia sp. CNPSo 3281]|uniref:alpha/beta fold hydrolase n=1 Tax=Paraburkholderia sp. CNPSo 3281 TaxID=2940933 RepID=UPI0020B81B24|nr:alpha/beta fold hydrolase [Paraburkholderia sp. CNPSo 3281]MCP3715567.1 alpha/beta fold hydrolase [Paraburkholderia sp. CNPSo 3281]